MISDERPPPVDVDAILVAMTLVPRSFSRNKMFALFAHDAVKRVRARAAALRGVVRHVVKYSTGTSKVDVAITQVRAEEPRFEIAYAIPSVGLRRRMDLSTLELSCVRFLLDRAGLPGHVPADADRAALEATLLRLSESGPLGFATLTSSNDDASLARA